MPESKIRKDAKSKQQHRDAQELAEKRATKVRLGGKNRDWVPWVFIPVGLLGVLWMVIYQLAGNSIGFLRALGDWNVLIGLGLIIACFSFMTLWK